MTATDRARAVVDELYDYAIIPTGGRDISERAIAAAIAAAEQEAVAAERERCAAIADERHAGVVAARIRERWCPAAIGIREARP